MCNSLGNLFTWHERYETRTKQRKKKERLEVTTTKDNQIEGQVITTVDDIG